MTESQIEAAARAMRKLRDGEQDITEVHDPLIVGRLRRMVLVVGLLILLGMMAVNLPLFIYCDYKYSGKFVSTSEVEDICKE